MAMATGQSYTRRTYPPRNLYLLVCLFVCLLIIYLLSVETEHRAPEYIKHVLYHLGHQPRELSYALLGFHVNSWKRILKRPSVCTLNCPGL